MPWHRSLARASLAGTPPPQSTAVGIPLHQWAETTNKLTFKPNQCAAAPQPDLVVLLEGRHLLPDGGAPRLYLKGLKGQEHLQPQVRQRDPER
jgi:hypothetical protein